MKAVFSKDQYSRIIVINGDTKERIFSALVLFPGTDPIALMAMKSYIDNLSGEVDAELKHELTREYNRLNQLWDNMKEYGKWGI